jgi:hypothetical protein
MCSSSQQLLHCRRPLLCPLSMLLNCHSGTSKVPASPSGGQCYALQVRQHNAEITA